MYADDTNLSFASDSIDVIEHNMNHDLANVKLIANKLTLNKSKLEFILIGSRQRLRTFEKSPSLVIDGASLKRVSNCKSLSVTIDEEPFDPIKGKLVILFHHHLLLSNPSR
jgi:hypothetical protein